MKAITVEPKKPGTAQCEGIPEPDVRNPEELAVESVPGTIKIPLPLLRARLNELPRDRKILVICRSTQRAYSATRILLRNGFKAQILSGGTLSRTNQQ